MRGTRAVLTLVVAVSAVGLAACGDDPAPAGGSSAGDGDTAAAALVGPAVLPSDGAPVLEGLSTVEAVDPDEAQAEADRWGDGSPGFAALYADASLGDPFDGPWVLATLHQGSENSGISSESFDPAGTATRWTDVPVEQLNQERRTGGLLSSGLDDATIARLVAGVDVTGAESDGRIELPVDEPDGLELVAEGRLDVASLATGFDEPAPGATARWASSQGWSDDLRSLRVTSYVADPALELLLRASTGGESPGPVLLPTFQPPESVQVGVRTLEWSTALVQSIGLDAGEVHGALKALEPVDAARWLELDEQVASTPPDPNSPNPTTVLSGRVPGGAFTADVLVGSMPGFGGGTVTTCESSTMVRTTAGDLRSGGSSSGECSEFGQLMATTLERGGLLIVGELPAQAAAVQVELPDGGVEAPELVGVERRLFALVLDDATFPTEATVLDDAGGTIAMLGPDDGMWSSITAGGWGSSSGRAFVAAG